MSFISLCGLPASGKTTFSHELTKALGSKLYCCDEFFYVNKGKPFSEIIEEFHDAIRMDLMRGYNVVCDGTYTVNRTRRELLDGISSVQCKKVIAVLTTPFAECLQRNALREARISERDMYSMQRTFEHPTLSEGWDEIIYVKEDGSYEKCPTGD